MKCPHCCVQINPDFREEYLGQDEEAYYSVTRMNCPSPSCGKLIIALLSGVNCTGPSSAPRGVSSSGRNTLCVHPLTSTRPPVPNEVDELFSGDYKEACLVLNFSPKASAALSRRCLQNVLREKAHVKHGSLDSEIQEVIDSNKLPSSLSESIDAVRNIGNFAAHPIKSTSTGEIVEVEPGEAEWLLDVLESLFDFYFVAPAVLKSKRDALNQKLIDAGKPPMK